MHANKLQNVLGMSGQERFSYLVRKVADSQEIWSMFDGGWATASDEHGNVALPFWPEERFAELCALGVWSTYKPRKIELDAFLDRWLPGMAKDSARVAAFPTPSDRGVIVQPELLKQEIESELEQYA